MWRLDLEWNGWVLSHADDSFETARVFALGSFESPEAAVRALDPRED